MHPKQTGVWLSLLVVIAFALRIGYCAVHVGLGCTFPENYREYIATGKRLLETGTIQCSWIIRDADANGPSAVLPPGYVALVAGVYWLFGVESSAANVALQIINAAATSLAVPFVFLIARRLAGDAAGWIAAVLATVNPTLIGFTDFVWDTCVFAFGISLAVWLSLRLSDRPLGWPAWTGFGLLLGGVALVSPALTVAYPFLVLWPVIKYHGWRLRPVVVPVVATVAGWLIAIGPWTVRNYVYFDTIMYVRGGLMMEVWLGVCPEAEEAGGAVYHARYPLKNAEEQEKVVRLGEERYLDACGELAARAIAEDPWRFLQLCAQRAIDYWFGTTVTHQNEQQGWWPRSRARAVVAVVLSAEVLVVVGSLLVLRRIPSDVAWLLAILLAFSLVYSATHVVVRFRAPMEPIMAVLAGVSAVRAYATVMRRCSAQGGAVESD